MAVTLGINCGRLLGRASSSPEWRHAGTDPAGQDVWRRSMRVRGGILRISVHADASTGHMRTIYAGPVTGSGTMPSVPARVRREVAEFARSLGLSA